MSKEIRRFDVAVIGAGINGAGVALDAALRGLRVVILDKNDMCSGCSAISSRLIHGGLRYLEYGEIPLVYESLHERRYLRLNAPHLVEPLRICLPIFEGAKRGPMLIRLGMLLYDMLSIGKQVPRHEMLDGDEIRNAEPGLNSDGLRAAARYYDAQVTFAERLVLEILLAARSAGAEILTHSEVTAIGLSGGVVESLTYVDRVEGGEHRIDVGTVINAAGPWVDRVLETAPVDTNRHIGGTKGSHIIVGPFDGAPSDAFYVEAESDGRPFFILPWNGQYLIGTTDIRYDDDLDDVRVSDAEVEYLLSETNRVFPSAQLGRENIHFVYSGIRPLPYQEKGPESAITRRHIIRANDEIGKGLLSIIGGKLTTYRNLAEQVVDRIAKLGNLRLPRCRTREHALPGAWGIESAGERLRQLDVLSDAGIERLLSVYGGRASLIAQLCEGTALTATLDDERSVLAGEVVFALRDEFARSLADIVFRRMMIGLDPDQGRPMYAAIAELAADEAGWSQSEKSRQLEELAAFANSWRVD